MPQKIVKHKTDYRIYIGYRILALRPIKPKTDGLE